jgi:L-ascorbate metabolism protein UlaG (beta-lactamase superfamily)
LEVREPDFVLYYEPHCVFEQAKLDHEHADVIVTPVVKQVLPGYTLVSGQDDAVQLAKILQPKFIVTLKNGDLESQGVLSWIVVEKGTVQSFKSLLYKSLPDVEVLEPEPGVPLQVPI